MQDSIIFKTALLCNDLKLLQSVAKTDLHNHSTLGGRLEYLEEYLRVSLPKPPVKMNTITDLEMYIEKNLKNIIRTKNGFEILVINAIRTAQEDGVTILEMSICSSHQQYYADGIIGLINFLKSAQILFPNVVFRPELGIRRETDLYTLESSVIPCIETGYFKSIDLTGNEQCGKIENYKNIYRLAKKYNMKLKAHLGEFSCANQIRQGVEILELSEVQHGISAYTSKEIMKWLADNKIQLNICPTSNVVLNLVASYKVHPIRILFDNGVKVTINSDDILLFNSLVSEEYLKMYNYKVFSVDELDLIRLQGFKYSFQL